MGSSLKPAGSGPTSGEAEPPPRSLSRAQRRVLRTREAIEDAFVPLVCERGYDKVSVEDIVAHADLSKGTF